MRCASSWRAWSLPMVGSSVRVSMRKNVPSPLPIPFADGRGPSSAAPQPGDGGMTAYLDIGAMR